MALVQSLVNVSDGIYCSNKLLGHNTVAHIGVSSAARIDTCEDECVKEKGYNYLGRSRCH